jgi:hypothetical protein
MITGPYYINLEHRTDRNDLVKGEFSRLGFRGIRIPAISNTDGALGCLDSHVKILNMPYIPNTLLETDDETVINMNAGPKPTATWVCEDDVQFLVDRQTLDLYIKEFMESDADILCLGYGSRKDEPYSPHLMRSYDLQTTSSYIIKDKFKNSLKDLWATVSVCKHNNINHPLMSSFKKLKVNKGDFWCADQCWKILQQSHVFVIPKTRCLKQRGGFSDIEKQYVDYGV